MDNVIISIEFTPCPIEQKAVYRVRYRRTPTEPFTTYPGTFLTSPIILSLPTEDFSQEYEGYVDTICGGMSGPSAYWKTGQGISPPVSYPSSLVFTLPIGAYFDGFSNILVGHDFAKALINWGDNSTQEIKPAPDSRFTLQHPYTDNTKEHTVIISFEKDTDLVEIVVSGNPANLTDHVDKITGVDSNKGLYSIIIIQAGLLQISGISSSTKMIDIRNNKLTSAYINQVLASLVLGGATGGLLDATGQEPAAGPTGAGISNKQLLIERGWTVNTD